MERLTEKVNGCNQIIKCGNDLCKETCEEWSCDFCPISEAIDKLTDYEDAEEQGLLLRLPVAIGTEVWKINKYSGGGRVADLFEIFPCEFDYNLIPMFGKTVFLTKEEAEQKLAEMKGDSDA